MTRKTTLHPKSADRRTAAPVEPLLHSGDTMDQQTFHDLYLKTPPGFKAELINGVVFVASPTTSRHGRPHARVVHWLSLYMDDTPGTDVFDNTTNILDEESEPQPDAFLIVQPAFGGQSREVDDYITGPAELVVEVAYSSRAIDLFAKRRDYEAAGVREYIVAEVEARVVHWFVRGRRGFTPLKVSQDGIFRSRVFPGLWLDPTSVYQLTTGRLTSVLRQGLASPEHAAFVKTLAARHRPDPNGAQ